MLVAFGFETRKDCYLVVKELVILLYEYVVGIKCFVMFCDVFSFPSGVYVEAINLIVSNVLLCFVMYFLFHLGPVVQN